MVLIAIIPFILALRLAAPVIKKRTKLRSLKWLQVILFGIDCAIFYTNLHKLFCQLISWINWVNSGKFMGTCWISCQVMADMKKVYNDLIIINLYWSRPKIRRAEMFFSCTKNCVFFSSASCKKDTIFGPARNLFGPSYFVTVLGKGCIKLVMIGIISLQTIGGLAQTCIVLIRDWLCPGSIPWSKINTTIK